MWQEPKTNVHSSPIMYWQGDHSYLWDLYQSKDDKYWRELYREKHRYGDQALISEHTDHRLFQDFMPENWFHLAGKRDSTFDFSDVKILQFIKTHTKPSTMPSHPMVQQHWH